MKRKKILLTLILTLLLSISFVLPAGAADAHSSHVIDNAGLLSSDEISTLNDEMNTLINNYNFDIILLTEDGLGGSNIQDYADDYYDENGFGAGDDKTGVLLLVDMGERNYYISTCGKAIDAFTDYGIERAGEAFAPYLSDEDYSGGFEKFLTITEDYITAYNDGTPYDSDNPYQESKNYVLRELIALAVALIIGFSVVLVLKSQMNNARPQEYAGNYLKDGSFHLTTQKDMFLYSQVTRVKKEKKESSGSSTHTSSSGTSHGGGGGSF